MKNTKKRKRVDEKQSNVVAVPAVIVKDQKESAAIVVPGNFIQFENHNRREAFNWKIEDIEPMLNLLEYLKFKPTIKSLNVSLHMHEIHKYKEAIRLLASNNTLTHLNIEIRNSIMLNYDLPFIKSLTSLKISVGSVSLAELTLLLKNIALKKFSLHLYFRLKEGDADEMARILSQHTTINELYLKFSDSKMTRKGLSHLLNNKTLHTFSFADCSPSIMGDVDILFKHPTLTHLMLSDCQISDVAAASLLENKVIKALDLVRDVQISEYGLNLFSKHPTLTSLFLYLYQIPITNQQLNSFMDRLTSFRCVYCTLPTLPTLPRLLPFATSPTLTHLELSHCRLISDDLFCFSSNKTLMHLNLNGNSLGDPGASILSMYPTTVTKLELGDCGITDTGAILLARTPRLTHLDLRNNNIGLSGIIAFAFNQTLSQLKLCTTECNMLPPLGLLFLLGNQSLRYLEYEDDCNYPSQDSKLSQLNVHLNKLGIRNPYLQSQYDQQVKEKLDSFFPTVLTKLVQDYSKHEYPFCHQLLNQGLFNQLGPKITKKFDKLLSELVTEPPTLNYNCHVQSLI